MVKEFEEGETYRNKKLDRDIMVFAVASKTQDEVVLAIGWVDRESEEMAANGEITIKTADFQDWEVIPE